MDTIYIEKDISSHPRTRAIVARFPQARQVSVDRFGDVFNASGQNFRVQKQRPALILARKHGQRVIETPPGYHIGGQRNFYFSHMLNCIYDCRYCFLQGMYRSANHVVFVNQEDFFNDIELISRAAPERAWFFSGYDCDSLALDPVTGFIDAALDAFERMPDASLEIRTKSTQIRPLLSHRVLDNVVVAYSLSPDSVAREHEHGAPVLAKRLDALATLQQRGWQIGLRFDPLLDTPAFETVYGEFFDQVTGALDMAAVHSVSLGVFRLPASFHRRLVRLYPTAPLLASDIQRQDGMVSYPESKAEAMRSFSLERLLHHVRHEQIFPCS